MIKKLMGFISLLLMCSIICPACYAEENTATISENEESTYNDFAVRLLDLPDLIAEDEEDEILTAADSFAKRSGLNIGIVITNDIGEDIPGKPKVKILDDYNYLTPAQEKDIISTARSFSDKSGFNIIFVITDEIGSDKSDRAVMNYADDRYDELCGINTDGILLLINNDTKYDWISTSGSCINYYSDERIQRIFDRIYDNIVAGDYYSACIGFVSKCEYYYNQGKANYQVGIESGDGYIEFDFVAYAQPLLLILVSVAIAAGLAYSVITAPYKLKKAVTTHYTVPGSLHLSIDTTESKGVITTRTYVPRSSGSSGRSGGGRSSTHRSSGGGRHGGGGRHR